MPGTFFGLEISRRGLQTHRTAMDTTGHNVANVDTPGYTRQEAVITATDPYYNPTLGSRLIPGQLGTGVAATMIRRIKNEYLDVQARDSTSAREYWQIQEEIFGRIEAVFPEPGSSGIADTLTKFFNYWQDLNNTPQDPGVKAAVAEVGDELATMMKEAYRQLHNISASILQINGGTVAGGQMKDQVDTVNGILAQIRELTESIKLIYAHGNQPNDLLDKRDLLLDRLSAYGPVSVTHLTDNGKPTGEIRLTFFGVDVRAADVSVSIGYSGGPPEEVKLVIGNDTHSEEVSLTSYPPGIPKNGGLPGLEEMRSRLAGYKDSLNELSLALKNTINQVLNPTPPGGGQDFFTGSLAGGDFAVADAVLADSTVIDGKRALFVARLATVGMDGSTGVVLGQDENGDDVTVDTHDLSGATFSEYFNGLLADIGARSAAAEDMTASQRAVDEQMEALRQSASGVNLDEELTRLIQFQYGYQASARVLSVLDEMLDHLINRTG